MTILSTIVRHEATILVLLVIIALLQYGGIDIGPKYGVKWLFFDHFFSGI